MIEKAIPGGMKSYLLDHPEILVAASAVLIGWNLYNLMAAVGLYHRAKLIVAAHQRAASEALGG
jgi:hypothetical protein